MNVNEQKIYEAGKALYLLSAPVPWENIRGADNNLKIEIGNLKASGCFPYYESKEDFKSDFPNEEPVVMYIHGNRNIPFPEEKT